MATIRLRIPSTGRLSLLFLLVFIVAGLFGSGVEAGVVEGSVFDTASGNPIPRVTIRVEGSGEAMLGNDDGRYRLRLPSGTYRLRFSHVAHYSRTVEVTVGDSPITQDVYLYSSVIELPGTRVYSRQYDPAQEVIIEAIRRKQELLAQIRDYQFAGYTKLIVQKLKEDEPDEFMLITETQLEGWYQQPDRYKEIITARRQSSNINAEGNLVTVGEIFNFNANRIELGEQAIVSPTATDALDFYNYYLLDTILLDGRPAIRLEIEPKSSVHPLFAGEILIADSTFAVVGVDVGLNEGFDAPYLSQVRYSQRMARFAGDIWMPIEIRIGAEVRLPIPGIPDMILGYTAVLNNLVINEGIAAGRFDEYVIEVAPEADDVDTAGWDLGALVPLTAAELDGYRHIDSLEKRPLSPKRVALYGALGLMMLGEAKGAYDFVHFNRVEGPYLGGGVTLRKLLPRSEIYLKSGWSFDSEYWQHHYRVQSLLHEKSRLTATFGYRDEVVARPTLFVDEDINPTFVALIAKTNPLDYYLEKGFEARLGFRPIRHTFFELSYEDYNQYSLGNVTEFDLFNIEKDHRPNPPIIDGKVRAFGARFIVDSRELILNKGREDTLGTAAFTRLELGAEGSDPDLVDSDFRYRRYYLSLYRRQALGGWGTTSLHLYGGGSDRGLPPQRYFTADFGDPDNIGLTQFKTLSETNFTGDRVVSWYLAQDFGGTLFRKLHVPLLNESPLSLLMFGGMFWSDFGGASRKVDGWPLHAAPEWYSEAGVGVGRIPPLFFKLYFTWQLSAYETNRFSVAFSMGF